MNREFSNKGNEFKKVAGVAATEIPFAVNKLHPSWRSFISYCAELKHGEIEQLKIQDGLPVLAEVTMKKVKFG